MTKDNESLADMRRRAAYMAGTGNYWAGKTVSLIDQIVKLEAKLKIEEEEIIEPDGLSGFRGKNTMFPG